MIDDDDDDDIKHITNYHRQRGSAALLTVSPLLNGKGRSKTLIRLLKSLFVKITVEYFCKIIFALPKVVRQQFVGEVNKFVTLWCRVSSGYCVPNIIKIG